MTPVRLCILADQLDADPACTMYTAPAADALRDAAHRLTDIGNALHIARAGLSLPLALDRATREALERIATLARGDA